MEKILLKWNGRCKKGTVLVAAYNQTQAFDILSEALPNSFSTSEIDNMFIHNVKGWLNFRKIPENPCVYLAAYKEGESTPKLILEYNETIESTVKPDLTTEEGRVSALVNLNKQCEMAFRNAGVELSFDCLFGISENLIEISIRNTDPNKKAMVAFGSEVQINNKKDNILGKRDYGFSTSSIPNCTPDDKISYWRIIHAASILKNWEVVTGLVSEYCEKSKELSNLIYAINNVEKIKA